MKALIVFGTRYGATAGTSEEIGKVLHNEGFDVRIVDAKKEKVKNISDYELILVGSGVKIGRWTKEPEKFLKKFASELSKKKVALFVSSAAQITYEHQGDEEKKEWAWNKYLVEKVDKYLLNPIAMAIFGGWVPLDDLGWLDKKMAGLLLPELEAAGIEKKNGIYDTRNWDAIRTWAKKLAQKVRG